MKIGLANLKFKNFDIKENCEAICRGIETNKELDLILFGESFLHGFDGLTWDIKKDLKHLKSYTPAALKKIRETCKEYQVAVGFGYFEVENLDIYSSYMIINHQGKILVNYRRQSIGWRFQNVSDNYKEGSGIASFDILGHSFDILLCGDGWHDEILEKYGRSSLLLWPLYVNIDIHSDIENYINRVKDKCGNVLIINSISNSESSKGGSFFIKNSKVLKASIKNKEEIIIETNWI